MNTNLYSQNRRTKINRKMCFCWGLNRNWKQRVNNCALFHSYRFCMRLGWENNNSQQQKRVCFCIYFAHTSALNNQRWWVSSSRICCERLVNVMWMSFNNGKARFIESKCCWEHLSWTTLFALIKVALDKGTQMGKLL